MNRYRIWHTLLVVSTSALLLAGCKDASVYDAHPVQRAPNISRPLSPDASVITPYTLSPGTDPEGGPVAGQKVVRVGLLLPLTGRNAELGKALQDAATLSLFDKYARLSVRQQTVRVELVPKDTGDTPQQATAAMTAAVNEGAEFIIGPLFSDATSAAAPVARAKNISVLSLSNNRAQATTGVYTFGFSPQEQTERVVSYALQNGKSRIAVLAPNSPLGDMVVAAAKASVEKLGLRLAVEARYLPQGAGIDQALNALVPPGRAPGFDALLLPEGGAVLDTLLRGLSIRGVKPNTVKFIGTGIWDDATLLHRINLDGAWFASSPPLTTSQFDLRFRSVYNYSPPRIASLSYDAVALAVTLATSGRPFDTTNLTNPAGFVGPANGIFRLKANGTVQRGLAVMQVDQGALSVVSPSPTGF